jgi:hypothetical protein
MPHDAPADLCTLTASRAARLMREGKLRKEALMGAYLDRVVEKSTIFPSVPHPCLFGEIAKKVHSQNKYESCQSFAAFCRLTF